MTTSADDYDVHYYLDINKQCQLVISILIYGLKLRLKHNLVLLKYLISNSILKECMMEIVPKMIA
jgi:hypothetical protein